MASNIPCDLLTTCHSSISSTTSSFILPETYNKKKKKKEEEEEEEKRMWESDSESRSAGGIRDVGGVGASSFDSGKHDASFKTDGFERRGQSWYVSSDSPSDVLVKVGDISFHLHKYPLLSRCGRMNRSIYESSSSSSTTRDVHHLELMNTLVEIDDLPGGPEAFELAAKFCYGVAVDLTASNISGLRCAAEYLEMTEDLEEGNLIFKTEAFLSYVVLSSWRDSIVVLKTCEGLSPWAENLQIVRRCSESIAWKACANPRGIRWAYSGRPPTSSSAQTASPRWKNSSDSKESSPGRSSQQTPVPPDWWFEDVSLLRIDHFVRVITAIKVKGMRYELIGAAITQYAARWLPGQLASSRSESTTTTLPATAEGLHLVVATGGAGVGSRGSDGGGDMSAGAGGVQIREQRMVIESLISIIPPQRDCVSCAFLLRLLRTANMLKVAPALVTELEKRVGMQLEQAALQDLLLPAYSSRCETIYDVDLVQRLLEHFLVQDQQMSTTMTAPEGSSPGRDPFSAGEKHGGGGGGGVYHHHESGHHRPPTAAVGGGGGGGGGGLSAKARVARLVDSYLTEVSRDRNLSLTKFQVLAEALPESARTCDDGLYRAVDSYLKAHPTLSEHERKRLCRAMDCQKLSMDACMHAAQNERLPLRVVVQILFSEQVKIAGAIAAGAMASSSGAGGGVVVDTVGGGNALMPYYQPSAMMAGGTRKQLLEGAPLSFQEGWAAAKKDINTLKFELENMKAKYLELLGDMDSMQARFEKMVAASSAAASASNKPAKQPAAAAATSAWASGWKKISKLGNKHEINRGQAPSTTAGGAAEMPRKGPRRWRNSIS